MKTNLLKIALLFILVIAVGFTLLRWLYHPWTYVNGEVCPIKVPAPPKEVSDGGNYWDVSSEVYKDKGIERITASYNKHDDEGFSFVPPPDHDTSEEAEVEIWCKFESKLSFEDETNLELKGQSIENNIIKYPVVNKWGHKVYKFNDDDFMFPIGKYYFSISRTRGSRNSQSTIKALDSIFNNLKFPEN